MTNAIRAWFERHFSDPQVLGLAAVLIGGFAIIWLGGGLLAPVIASVVIAYLLEGLIGVLERYRAPRLAAVLVVFIAFMTTLFFVMFGLLPLLSSQATQLLQQLPTMLGRGQELLLALPLTYPDLFSEQQVLDLISQIRAEAVIIGQNAVQASLASVVGILTLLVYLILMPLMVFFFLKDKLAIVAWVKHFLPEDRRLAGQVWADVNTQIGNYVRGKVIEIVIVWIVTYLTFALMGLQFSMLLGALVGLSVVIPYVGAVAVTFPVAIIAYFQWGFTSDFAYIMIAYAIIQALDGNVLVPLLFSEVVNLHPIAIITAVLVFGGLWGFWGIFFAIPLATLVQAVLKAWPSAAPPAPDPG
ncbi:MAG: AI-2E family transporter [Thiotrichales bacterium]|nr:AI-2E family transporter [Thiotrichales bacterium]MCY4284225.1 AI-2E family transporter [Thiotrichales bacterium]MCY4349971.1 AI-2E family transporter [Thiotrichales bacterium]